MQIAQAKRKFVLLSFFSIIVLFSSVNLIAMNAVFLSTDNIYPGVTIGNIPVGGLSTAEAQSAIRAAFEDQTINSNITIKYEDQTWAIKPQEIEITINAEELAKKAHSLGRDGTLLSVLQDRYLIITNGYNVPFTQNYNPDKLSAILTTIAKTINYSPQNALLTYKENNIQIAPETWGQQVNLTLSLGDITNKLKSRLSFTSELMVEKISPTIKATDFSEIDCLLAAYSTQFDPNNKNRYQNVALAANKINNQLVHPNEVFSFNKTVGLRLQEYGYKEAPVLVDGKVLLDWGGGVCQVSTTLYNASLLADMDIQERTSHFQPPSYVPLGQDAAVADNLLDFKFKNNSRANIYITSEVSNNQITILIFGKKQAKPAEITIETSAKTLAYETIIKQDNSLPVGKEIVQSAGQRGFEVVTYRVKSTNGKEISRETLSSDEFKPENRVIRIGPKALSKKPTK